jgi:hypothetical protein
MVTNFVESLTNYYYNNGWQYLNPPNTSRALSNLTATSINKLLVPASSGTTDLGSSTITAKSFSCRSFNERTLDVTSGGLSLNKASHVC